MSFNRVSMRIGDSNQPVWTPPDAEISKRRGRRVTLHGGTAPLCEFDLSDMAEASAGTALYLETLLVMGVVFVLMTLIEMPVFIMAFQGHNIQIQDSDLVGLQKLTAGNILMGNTSTDATIPDAVFPPSQAASVAAACSSVSACVFAVSLCFLAWRAHHVTRAADLAHVTAADYAVKVQGLPHDVTEAELRDHFSHLYALDKPDWVHKDCCRRKTAREPTDTFVWSTRRGEALRVPATPNDTTSYNRDPTYLNSWVADVVIAREDAGSLATFHRMGKIAKAIREARARVRRFSQGTADRGGPNERKRRLAEDRLRKLSDRLLHLARKRARREGRDASVDDGGLVDSARSINSVGASNGPMSFAADRVAQSVANVGFSVKMKSKLGGNRKVQPTASIDSSQPIDVEDEGKSAAERASSFVYHSEEDIETLELSPLHEGSFKLEALDGSADGTMAMSGLGNAQEEAQRRARREKVLQQRRPVLAYVVFNNEESFRRAVADYSSFSLCQPRSLRLRGHSLQVSAAEEPEDVVWENLEVPWWNSVLRRLAVLVLVLVVLALAFVAVLIMQALKVQATRLPPNRVCDVDVPLALSGEHHMESVRNRTADALCDEAHPGSVFLGISAASSVTAPITGIDACSATCIDPFDSTECPASSCNLQQCGAAPLPWRTSDRVSCYCLQSVKTAIEQDGYLAGIAQISNVDADLCGPVAVGFVVGAALAVSASLAVVIVNAVLKATLSRVIRWERHATLTGESKALARMVFWSQLANTAVITVLVQARSETAMMDIGFITLLGGDFPDIEPRWYSTVGFSLVLVFAATAFGSATFNVIWYTLVQKFQRRRAAREAVNSQAQMDAMFVAPPFSLTVRVSTMLAVVWFAVALGPALPILLPISAAAMFVTYWVEKWILLRHAAAPLKYGRRLADLGIELLPYALVVHCLFAIYIFSSPTDEDDLRDSAPKLAEVIDNTLGRVGLSVQLRQRPFQEEMRPLAAVVVISVLYLAGSALYQLASSCGLLTRCRSGTVDAEGNPSLTAPFAKRVDSAGSFAEDSVHKAEGWRVVDDRDGHRWLLKVWPRAGRDSAGQRHGSGELKVTWQVLREQTGIHSYRINDNPAYRVATHTETLVLENYRDFVKRVKRGVADDIILGADRDADRGALALAGSKRAVAQAASSRRIATEASRPAARNGQWKVESGGLELGPRAIVVGADNSIRRGVPSNQVRQVSRETEADFEELFGSVTPMSRTTSATGPSSATDSHTLAQTNTSRASFSGMNDIGMGSRRVFGSRLRPVQGGRDMLARNI